MKKITSLSILILFCVLVYGQKEYIIKNKNYSHARIYKKDYKILKVNNLELINDTIITFKEVGSSQKSELSVSDVKYFSVRKGSYALTYGLIGAGCGLLGSLLGVAQLNADPMTDASEVNYTPIIIGITAGFGLLGAFIGAFSYKWKRLYFQNREVITS